MKFKHKRYDESHIKNQVLRCVKKILGAYDDDSDQDVDVDDPEEQAMLVQLTRRMKMLCGVDEDKDYEFSAYQKMKLLELFDIQPSSKFKSKLNNNNDTAVAVNSNDNKDQKSSKSDENIKNNEEPSVIDNSSRNLKSIIVDGLSVGRRYQTFLLGHYYSLLSGNAWLDSKETVATLFSLLPQVKLSEIPTKYHLSLNSGDRSSWEIPLIHHILQLICKHLQSKSPSNAIEQHLEFSNTLSDLFNCYVVSSSVIDTANIKEDFDELLELLSTIGVSKQEIDSISSSVSINKSTEKQVASLITQIKSMTKNHNYIDPIKLCNDGINIFGISFDSLAKFYFYRGYSNEMQRLKSGQLKSPREDVLLDLNRMKSLKPYWKYIPFLMAVILYHDDKLEESKKSISSCLVIDPNYLKAKALSEMLDLDLKLIQSGLKDSFQNFDPDIVKTLLNQRNMNVNDKTINEYILQVFQRSNKNVENGLKYLYGLNDTPKDMVKALELFQASPNDKEALHYSGIILQQSKTVYRDLTKAFQCFERANQIDEPSHSAANTILVDVVTPLSNCYRYGIGVEININKAISILEDYIKKPGLQNKDVPVFNLGCIYYQSLNLEDHKKAVQLFQVAASSGYPEAILSLGKAYFEGKGVSKDMSVAAKWFKKARDLKHPNAQDLLDQAEAHLDLKQFPEKLQDIVTKLQAAYSKSSTTKKNISDPYPVDELKKYSKTPFAAKLLEAKLLFLHALDLISKKQESLHKEIISTMARCYELTELVALTDVLLKYFLPILESYRQKNPMDEDARYCYAFICIYGKNDFDIGIPFLQKCIQDFPNNHHLYILGGNMFAFKCNIKESMKFFARALEIMKQKNLIPLPDIYFRLGAARSLFYYDNVNANIEDYIADLLKFVQVCEIDHRYKPMAYYYIGCIYVTEYNMDLGKKYYQMGLDAEKDQLPFFMPYESTQKQMLEMKMHLKKDDVKNETKPKPATSTTSTSSPKQTTTSATTTSTSAPIMQLSKSSILDIHREKSTVESYHRQILITQLRYYISMSLSNKSFIQKNAPPVTIQKMAPKDIGESFKEIFVNQFEPTRDLVYKGRYVQGIVVERLWKMEGGAGHSIMVDNKGTFMRISIYDNKINSQAVADQTLFVGQGITILDPYHRIGMDGKPSFRIDSISKMVIDELKPNQVCYYCFKQSDKLQRCSNCKSALYCSRECQVSDYKILDHKSICKQI